jgi:hypothetical protein
VETTTSGSSEPVARKDVELVEGMWGAFLAGDTDEVL